MGVKKAEKEKKDKESKIEDKKGLITEGLNESDFFLANKYYYEEQE